jgi:hypothetical protein
VTGITLVNLSQGCGAELAAVDRLVEVIIDGCGGC